TRIGSPLNTPSESTHAEDARPTRVGRNLETRLRRRRCRFPLLETRRLHVRCLTDDPEVGDGILHPAFDGKSNVTLTDRLQGWSVVEP
ncbi:Unknown protein, partial [Striga hermonthica]